MGTHRDVPRSDAGRHVVRDELTSQVIGAFYTVYNALGYGLLESVNSKALRVELQRRGIPFRSEVGFTVTYQGVDVGLFRADLVVADSLLVEIKSTHSIAKVDFRQVVNYLKVSGLPRGLLLHFGPRPDFHRVVLTR